MFTTTVPRPSFLAQQQVLKTVAADPAQDAGKGLDTRHQLVVWESLMEMRIRLQKPLALANTLPQGDALPATYAARVSAELTAATREVAALCDTLVALQQSLLAVPSFFPAAAAATPRKRKRAAAEGEAAAGEPHADHAADIADADATYARRPSLCDDG